MAEDKPEKRRLTDEDEGKKIRLKIIGDPTLGICGTKVIDLDSGKELAGVRSVTWCHRAGCIPTCNIEVIFHPVEAIAEGKVLGAIIETETKTGLIETTAVDDEWHTYVPIKAKGNAV
jgi:hypothetical protein